MPRAGGIYSAPPGTDGVPNATIESAKYNALVADLVQDANAARPITAGGSGQVTAIAAADAFSPTSTDIASATTTNLANATGVVVNITGTTTITGLGTVASGALRVLVFGGILTLTHHATSLILPSAANIVTAAGDVATMRSKGSGNWVCVGYQRAAGTPLVASAIYGTQNSWIPADWFIPRITNGPSVGVTEATTNDHMLTTLDFDTTTEELASYMWFPPKRWDLGTITFIPVWTAASGSGTVEWKLSAVALSNDDPIDTATGTGQVSNDTLLSALDVHVGPASSAITIAGTPAAADTVMLTISRNVSNDNLGVDAKLIGLRLIWTSNANTDA